MTDQLVTRAASYRKQNEHKTRKCTHRDSKPRSQQSSGRRPTSWTARPPDSAGKPFTATI